ncbi:MAG TPA: gluconokinase [Stellaceae bacterium]|nr:gluconokinase [Stellaceae bacterium]
MPVFVDLPSVIVVMGVSGAGKTTVGKRLADRLGWEFIEGDRLHPPENVAKMKSGQPLDDADRAPWLAAVAQAIDDCRSRGGHAVVACSALKQRYRQVIIGDRPDVRLVYLAGSRARIAERLKARRGHFMPASLLDSQFAALEPPAADERPIIVPVEAPVATIVEDILAALPASPGQRGRQQ